MAGTKPDVSGPKSGKFDRERSNRSYYDSRKKSDYKGGFFTFKDEKVIEGIESYTHNFRLILMNIYPTNTADDGIATLAKNAYEQGHISGHMKDENATEYADYVDYCEELWSLFGQLRNELAAVHLLDDPTFSDVTPTTGSAHSFLKPESVNTLIETLENRNLVVPVWIVALLKKLTGIRCKLTDDYEIYGTTIPASYIVFGVRDGDLEDLQGLRDTAFENKGNAIQHMNKFGISYVKFTASLLTEYTEIKYQSDEWYFYIQNFSLLFYGEDAATYEFGIDGYVEYSGSSPATTTGFWCFLPDGRPNPDYVYATLFGSHADPNNIYGGLFVWQCNASSGDTNLFYYTQTSASGTVVDPVNTAAFRSLMFLWPTFGSDDLLGADKLDLALTGAAFAATIPVGGYDSLMHINGPMLFRTTKTVSQIPFDSLVLKQIIQLSNFK
jgi:hypothetical protein